MQIGNWSRRRIARLWWIGLAIEAAMIAGPLAWERLHNGEDHGTNPLWAQLDSLNSDTPPAAVIVPDSTARKFEAFVRDSLGIDVRRRDGTLEWVARTPRAKAALDSLHMALDEFSDLVGWLVVAFAAVYLPIPVGLVGTTCLWWWQRRKIAIRVADES